MRANTTNSEPGQLLQRLVADRGAERVEAAPPRMEVWCHPEAFDALRAKWGGSLLNAPYTGVVTVVADERVPKHPRRWEWPRERFFEYGERDDWARYFGYGRWVEDETRYAYFLVDALEPPTDDWHRRLLVHKEWDVPTADGRKIIADARRRVDERAYRAMGLGGWT